MLLVFQQKIKRKSPVTDCTSKQLNFSPLGSKKVTGSFSGGSITSDGGLLLLREIDKKHKITDKFDFEVSNLS